MPASAASLLLALALAAAPAATTGPPSLDPVAGQPTGRCQWSDAATIASQLETENDRLKQDLQAAIETYQATHEEFTAANEEVLATNEELQATNEELETSKEELQSVNEELITVNNQLNEKLEDLSKANDDLANFLNSSDVATLFLDRRFCIRRFTASATRLMNVLSLDIGRPIKDIANQLVNVTLTSVADAVLKNLAT